MKTITITRVTTLAAAIGLVLSSGAFAAETASHDVNITVSAINEITVDATPVAMTINSASDTDGTNRITTVASSWGIFTNTPTGSEKKVTAELDALPGTGLTLKVTATAPTNGSSEGEVELGTTAADVVTAIFAVDELAGDPLALSYKLYATKDAAAGDTNTIEVTYTVTDDV